MEETFLAHRLHRNSWWTELGLGAVGRCPLGRNRGMEARTEPSSFLAFAGTTSPHSLRNLGST